MAFKIAPRLSVSLNEFASKLREILERVKSDGNTSENANRVGLLPACLAFDMDDVLKVPTIPCPS